MGRSTKTEGPEIDWDSEVIYKYGFERLCSAVVAQAAKDKAWWFFKSEVIRLYLSDNVDPLNLMYQIKENYEVYGRWSAIDTNGKHWIGREEDILK